MELRKSYNNARTGLSGAAILCIILNYKMYIGGNFIKNFRLVNHIIEKN